MQAPEYDSSDLDALLELERSQGWALVAARINRELERRRTDLETGGGEPEHLRGQCKSLRTVLQIPTILKAEIKAILEKR